MADFRSMIVNWRLVHLKTWIYRPKVDRFVVRLRRRQIHNTSLRNTQQNTNACIKKLLLSVRVAFARKRIENFLQSRAQ